MSTVVTLKKGEGRYLKAGGAWVFDNEIATIKGTFNNGAIVNVEDFDGYKLGKGYINQNSKIRVRMMTRKPDEEIDEEFFKRRIQNAWNYRKRVMYGGNDAIAGIEGIGNTGRADLNCCRIIFGEADFLPGIVVDKYNDCLVMQSLTLGMEAYKQMIAKLLVDILKEDGITINTVYERSDAKERKKEGLSVHKGVLIGANDFDGRVTICENGIKYELDVINGQKTGFFLDQKYNRLAIQRLCKDATVLDCFTHMGTFALNAGFAGAKEVTGLDISEYAVEQARNNAMGNKLQERVFFRQADVLDELPRLIEAGQKYDVVILDPPAFTKSKEATKNAIKGYREINMKGLRLVKNGGYFATCSCSHFMTEDLFKKTVNEAAVATKKRLRQIEARTQGPDHPILWAADESYYLKFYIFQVCEER